MNPEKTVPVSVHDQLLALGSRTGSLRRQLDQGPYRPDKALLEDLGGLELTLTRLGGQLRDFEKEHGNLAALVQIGQVVNSSLELDEVLRIVMDNIIRLTHAERGFLMLREESGEMVTRVARNWGRETISPKELTFSRTVVQQVIDSGEPLVTMNAQDDERLMGRESIVSFNLRSILCVPLKVKNELIGVIYTDNRARSGIFAESERDLLAAFANQAAVALDNARLFSFLKGTLAEVTGLKAMMDNIFACIASGVITADVQNQITLCNRAAAAMLGRPSADLVGRQLDEVLPLAAAGIQPRIDEMHETDKPVLGLEISHDFPGLGSLDWRLNLSPLKDADQRSQGIAIVLDDLTERKRLEAQRRLLERMVSPAVLDQIDPNSLQIGGKRADITIFFADIRGFTDYSARQTPEELVSVLNRYLAAAAEAVLAQEGTVDKFLGDAVMAWFNAPLPQPDHTLRAVRAALALRQSVENLHRELPEADRMSFGIGIHYGEALLGWIGTERRLEYTAISDSVNIARRIQENASHNQILISEEAYARVRSEIDAQPCAPLNFKGRAGSLRAYEVLGLR
ncbi:MAG: adenylate/guanylate cyclase domain-containing protein [Bacteroidota bacterium]